MKRLISIKIIWCPYYLFDPGADGWKPRYLIKIGDRLFNITYRSIYNFVDEESDACLTGHNVVGVPG